MTYEMKLREERKLGQSEGRKEGIKEGKAEMVLSMLKEHINVDNIRKYSNWSREAILLLAQKNGILIPNVN